MVRPLVVVAACAVSLVVGVGAGALAFGGTSGESAVEKREGGVVVDGQRELDAERRELASCREDRRSLEEALNKLRRASGGAAVAARPDAATAAEKTAAAENSAANAKRGVGAREAAAAADDPRTGAWIERVGGDLALTDKQKTELNGIARWAADQRSALKEKAARDQLDSESVRAEIADQRAEYEARMKALLTADEWIAFDAVQGVERRPPTFARMPDILGEQAQPKRPEAKDAG